MTKWNKDLLLNIAKKYECLTDFYQIENAAYIYAKRSGLLKELYWLKRKKLVLNNIVVIQESKKYKSRGDFCRNSHSHYNYARKNKLLDKMYWLEPKTNSHKDAHCIYAYIDKDNKAVYVGQTMRKMERDKEHRSETKSSVFKYFAKINKNIPTPIYLEEKLQDKDAQIREDFWINHYRELGYFIINKAKTGICSGSLGLCHIKWTKKNVFKEAKKYSSSGEFRIKCNSAYQIACRKKWIYEIAHELNWKIRIKK